MDFWFYGQPSARNSLLNREFTVLNYVYFDVSEIFNFRIQEQRTAYDRRLAESHQVEQAWSELSELLSQLHKKMEYAANTIRCTNCGKRHRRIRMERPCYAARFCAQCRIHHNAREVSSLVIKGRWNLSFGISILIVTII